MNPEDVRPPGPWYHTLPINELRTAGTMHSPDSGGGGETSVCDTRDGEVKLPACATFTVTTKENKKCPSCICSSSSDTSDDNTFSFAAAGSQILLQQQRANEPFLCSNNHPTKLSRGEDFHLVFFFFSCFFPKQYSLWSSGICLNSSP